MSSRRAWDFETGEQPWQERAACHGTAPAMDTTDLAEAAPLIRKYCHSCQVLDECHAEVLSLAGASQYGTDRPAIPQGIWAGQVWKGRKPHDAPTGHKMRLSCGSNSGYETHRRNQETPCVPCYQAMRGKWTGRAA